MPAQQEKKYGKVWGNQAEQFRDLVLPTGETVLVRRPGVTGLMQAGILGDLDVLTSLVDKKHVKPHTTGKGRQPKAKTKTEEVADILKNPEQLEAVRRVCLKVVAYVVVRPTVRLHFTEVPDPRDGKRIYMDIPQGERDLAPSLEYPEDPVVYTDAVDFEDAMFMLNYAVGGTSDLQSFRGQLGESMASLESLQDVSGSAK